MQHVTVQAEILALCARHSLSNQWAADVVYVFRGSLLRIFHGGHAEAQEYLLEQGWSTVCPLFLPLVFAPCLCPLFLPHVLASVLARHFRQSIFTYYLIVVLGG